MALMSESQYIESMVSCRKKVFILGEEVADYSAHPLVRPSLNACALTYGLAESQAYSEVMLASSHLSGSTINRFTHLHQSNADLITKVRMLRLLGQKTGTCFQRCSGMDALAGVDFMTFNVDEAMGTDYHARFIEFLREVQDRDLVVDAAMTDPKGDRRRPPSKQSDRDMYVRIVDRRKEGVVVRGAKVSQTGALNSHEVLVMPTRALADEDSDYAICFAVPADTTGIVYVLGRQPSDTRKLERGGHDVGNRRFGGHEAIIFFQDVLVPWERVFLCGESRFAGQLVERFAAYHRQSYGGCKVGVGDVLIGAVQAIARYQGIDSAAHVKEKIVEMVHLNETLFACGLACSAVGLPSPSGTYGVDPLLANICKLNVTRFPYEIARLAQDIAGGLLVTLPSEKDFANPVVGPLLAKYLKGADCNSTEDRRRMLRLIENLTLGPGAACYLTESMHGAGSPQAQMIMLGRLAGLEEKVEFAESLAEIGDGGASPSPEGSTFRN